MSSDKENKGLTSVGSEAKVVTYKLYRYRYCFERGLKRTEIVGYTQVCNIKKWTIK